MDKEFYDKYGKEFHCAECTFLDNCLKSNEPLYGRCCEKFLRDKISDIEKQLAESENKHLLDEKEWQDYCAFKHIEPQIRGCLDREREYEKQLAEKEKEISNIKGLVNERDRQIKNLKTNKKRAVEHKNKVKISFCIKQLEKVKEKANEKQELDWGIGFRYKDHWDIVAEIDNQIKQLREGK